MKKPFDHTGSSFESFLEEKGILEAVESAAMARVLEWQREKLNPAPENQQERREFPRHLSK